MTPGCFGSNLAHSKSEVSAKADMGQGFEEPERLPRGTEPPAGPSPFSDANARTPHTKRFCPSQSSVNLALRSRLFVGPSRDLPPRPDNLPLHLCELHGDRRSTGKHPYFGRPRFPLPLPLLCTLLL